MKRAVFACLFGTPIFLCAIAAWSADDSKPCAGKAMDLLKQYDPNGYEVIQRYGNPEYFSHFLECSEFNYNVETSVHETTHKLSGPSGPGDAYKYYLPNGGGLLTAPALEHAQLFNRSDVAALLDSRDRNFMYVSAYLTGGQGARDLLPLLDELNAYTHQAITAAALVPFIRNWEGEHHLKPLMAERDGVAAFLYYTELYLRLARTQHDDLYSEFLARWKPLLATLWGDAEAALKAAYPADELGVYDQFLLNKVYTPDNFAEIAPFLEDPALASHKFFTDEQAAARPNAPKGLEKPNYAADTDGAIKRGPIPIVKTSPSGPSKSLTVTIATLNGVLDHIICDGKTYTPEEFKAAFANDPAMTDIIHHIERLQAKASQ